MTKTDFEIKNELLALVNYSTGAYNIAVEFVQADENKLIVFTRAFVDTQAGSSVDSRSASAVILAKERWDVMYPPVKAK